MIKGDDPLLRLDVGGPGFSCTSRRPEMVAAPKVRTRDLGGRSFLTAMFQFATTVRHAQPLGDRHPPSLRYGEASRSPPKVCPPRHRSPATQPNHLIYPEISGDTSVPDTSSEMVQALGPYTVKVRGVEGPRSKLSHPLMLHDTYHLRRGNQEFKVLLGIV